MTACDPEQARELVTATFRAVLRREPDPSGLAAYQRLFLDRPLPEAVQRTVEGLLGSGEFARLQGGTGSAPASTVDQPRYITTDDIEIVMITYNEEEIISCSLTSLINEFERFVFLDMGSTDRTRMIISDIIGKRGRIVPYNRRNLLEYGYAHARNFGACYATARWILTVDADEALVAGVTDGRVAIDRPIEMSHLVTLRRHNFGCGDWRVGEPVVADQRWFISTEEKYRLYRPGTRARWEGYIHEEIAAPDRQAYSAGSSIELNHFSNHKKPGKTSWRRHMYSWMLLRAYEDQALQYGINRHWIDNYIPSNIAAIRAEAALFERDGESTN